MNISGQYDSPKVAVAQSLPSEDRIEGRLSVYNLHTESQESAFPVRWDSGGRRLSISRDDRWCFAGCFNVYGLAAYACSDGAELWRRKDLKAVQWITAFPSDDYVFCGRAGAGHLLCSKTGQTLDKPRGVKGVYTSPFGKHVLVSARDLELHSPYGTRIGKIQRWSFADLGCCFSETEVLLTEAGAPVRCFDLGSLALLWKYKPPRGHFLRLAFCKSLDCFVGVHFPNNSNDRIKRVFLFNRRTGEITSGAQLGAVGEAEFCLAGRAVFTSDQRLLDAQTGNLICEIVEMPQDEGDSV